MADEPLAPADVPVTDHRQEPRGVWGGGSKTTRAYALVALAFVVIGGIALTGPSRGPRAPVMAGELAPVPLNPDRLKDYQQRLRAAEQQAQDRAAQQPVPILAPPEEHKGGRSVQAGQTDQSATDRAKRDADSLFASNVVVSRRPANDQPVGSTSDRSTTATGRSSGAVPTVDETAEAVIRASQRLAPAPAQSQPVTSPVTPLGQAAGREAKPQRTPPIDARGPLHTLLEGSIIDAVLTNRLDGSNASPVNALVTNPVYSHAGDRVLIPAGARVLGETKPVQSFGESRLAVTFHRIVFPDGSTQSLDHDIALNPAGDTGLKDQVNNHFASTFGLSAAVGLVSGLSQLVGTRGLGGDGNNRTVVVTGDIGNRASQSTEQVLARYLNRPPTITIREGHRLKVVLIHDLELPPYPAKERAQ